MLFAYTHFKIARLAFWADEVSRGTALPLVKGSVEKDVPSGPTKSVFSILFMIVDCGQHSTALFTEALLKVSKVAIQL